MAILNAKINMTNGVIFQNDNGTHYAFKKEMLCFPLEQGPDSHHHV